MSFTSNDDVNMLQASDKKNIGARGGNDRYILAPNQLSKGQTINIIDNQGVNTLHLTGGLTITNSLVSHTKLQLILSNGAVVKITGAHRFNFALGGDPLTANGSELNNFLQFTSRILGVESIPKKGTTQGRENILINEDGSANTTIPFNSYFDSAESSDLSTAILDNVSMNPNAANGLRDGVDGNILWSKKKVPSGKKSVDGLLISVNRTQNQQWSTSLVDDKTEISFSFAKNPPKYGPAYDSLMELKASFVPLNDSQQQLARDTLLGWSKVIPLSFAERDEPDSVGDIRWFASNAGQQIGTASALAPNDALSAAAGDIWIGPNYPEQYNNPTPGGYGYQTFLHELGHILGLIHPQDAVIPIDPERDQLRYTVMSYRDFAGDDLNGYDAKRFFPTTPMLDDIAALQYLYGANWNYKSESNTYTWAASTPIFETVWDGGGTGDTFNGANQIQAVIFNLNPGTWSSIGQQFWDGQALVRNGLTIAYGVDIENAIGSNFHDTLIGNPLPNRLEAGLGNDTLQGGGGRDEAVYQGFQAGFEWKIDNRKILIRDIDPSDGDEGNDTLINIETLVFRDVEVSPPISDEKGAILITDNLLIDKVLIPSSGNKSSNSSVLSPDGQWLVFYSESNNLLPGDNNGSGDIFLKNLNTGVVSSVNRNPDGTLGNGRSDNPIFSPDSQLLAFTSSSSNLVENDTNQANDLFILDLQSQKIQLVNSRSDGTPGNQGVSQFKEYAFSPDNRTVAFTSSATNLVSGETNTSSESQLFIKDLESGITKLVSMTPQGINANGPSFQPAYSSNGRWLVFGSFASDLVAGDDNGFPDIFLKNNFTGEIILASRGIDGISANASSWEPTFSPDGNWLVFESNATNLVEGMNRSDNNLYIKNLETGKLTLANTTSQGVLKEGYSDYPFFSPDGQWLAFSTDAPLVSQDDNETFDVYLKNLMTNEIRLMSQKALPTSRMGKSYSEGFSPNGEWLAVISEANLVPLDTNDKYDVFLINVATGRTIMANSTVDGLAGDQGTDVESTPWFSPDGQWLAFVSYDHNLLTQATQNDSDVYLKNIVTGEIKLANSSADGVRGNDSSNDIRGFTSDGQWLIFHSKASNLVAGDTNQQEDVYLKNMRTGQIMMANSNSIDLNYPIGSNGKVKNIQFSADGRWLGFESDASNLTTWDNNGQDDVFLFDMSSGQLVLPNTSKDGKPGNGGSSLSLFSANAHRLIFTSNSSNLTSENLIDSSPDNPSQIYVKDLLTGQMTLVATTPDGLPGNGRSEKPVLSNDGRWLVFQSTADNLKISGAGTGNEIYLKNLDSGQIGWVASASDLTGELSDVVGSPVFSPNSEWLAFTSYAPNLVANDDNTQSDVFIKRLSDNEIVLVSQNAQGKSGSGPSNQPLFSPDNKWLAFESAASDLIVGEHSNDWNNLFLRNLETGSTQLANNYVGTIPGAGWSNSATFSTSGQWLLFAANAPNPLTGEMGNERKLFFKNLNDGQTRLVNTSEDGSEGNGTMTHWPVFSPHDEWLAFWSNASNLVENDANKRLDLFLKNPLTGQNVLINAASDGSLGNDNLIMDPESSIELVRQGYLFISDQGPLNEQDQWLIFISKASNLVVNDDNGANPDVFVRNLQTGEVQLLFTAADGTQANKDNDNYDFACAPDARSVVFASSAYNIVPGDKNGVADVFIKDLFTGSVQRLVVGQGETFEDFEFSPTGEYISYIGGGHLYVTPNPYWLG